MFTTIALGFGVWFLGAIVCNVWFNLTRRKDSLALALLWPISVSAILISKIDGESHDRERM